MKKLTSVLLTVILLTGVLVPSFCYGENLKNNQLEESILLAKTKLDIPEELTKFDYDVYTSNGKTSWHMRWYSEQSNDGQIYVTVDEKGNINNYSYYNPKQQINEIKFPKYSKDEAKTIAEDFINKIDQQLLNQVEYEDTNQMLNMSSSLYKFDFIRKINNIPYYSNRITIQVDKNFGYVRYYNRNWDDDLSFPEPEEIVSKIEAQNSYKEKLGLELVYKCNYDDEEINPYLVYTTKYNTNYCIDAFSGEKFKINQNYYACENVKDKSEEKDLYNNSRNISNLSPEELKAIKEVDDLLSKEEVESIARNTEILELDETYELKNISLNKDWPIRTELIWYLSFIKESNDNINNKYASIKINAKTGEIKDFYISNQEYKNTEAKFSKKECERKTEEFLKSFIPNKYSQVEFDKIYDESQTYDNKLVTAYTFKYIRKINGISFKDNYIIVRYNPVDGKVISFNLKWYNLEFTSNDKVIDIKNIYENFFEQIGLKLQYKSNSEDSIIPLRKGQDNLENTTNLVYAIYTDKPLCFDAITGSILNNDGTVYKEEKPIEYNDIESHYAEKQINVLAEYNIGFDINQFKPNQIITQKDFFVLYMKAIGYNYMDEEEMYDYLIRQKIIDEKEKLPEAEIKRIEAVKYLIRALKYEKIAEMSEMFNCPFDDVNLISPELKGYVTIAKGLGIINGSNGIFSPNDGLKRADAAIIIYNLLNTKY